MDSDTTAALAEFRNYIDRLATITEAEHEAIKHRLHKLEKKVYTISEVAAATTKVIKELSNLHP